MSLTACRRLLAGVALLLARPALAQLPAPNQLVPPLGPPRKHYLFAQKEAECPVVANVTKNTDEDADVSGSYTRVCYRSAAQLLLELNELRKIHAWADSTYQRRLAALPAGGVLTAVIHRQGPKGANPGYLFFTLKGKDGQDLASYNPAPATGRFFGRDLYQQQAIMPLTTALPPTAFPLALTINDTRLRQLFEYTINQPE